MLKIHPALLNIGCPPFDLSRQVRKLRRTEPLPQPFLNQGRPIFDWNPAFFHDGQTLRSGSQGFLTELLLALLGETSHFANLVSSGPSSKRFRHGFQRPLTIASGRIHRPTHRCVPEGLLGCLEMAHHLAEDGIDSFGFDAFCQPFLDFVGQRFGGNTPVPRLGNLLDEPIDFLGRVALRCAEAADLLTVLRREYFAGDRSHNEQHRRDKEHRVE